MGVLSQEVAQPASDLGGQTAVAKTRGRHADQVAFKQVVAIAVAFKAGQVFSRDVRGHDCIHIGTDDPEHVRWFSLASRMDCAVGADGRFFGLDGCPGGWVVASCSGDLAVATFRGVSDGEIKGFLASLVGTRAVVAIDVPIGLAECEPRTCDQAARRRLGAARQNSVFSPPCRGTLVATDYAQACAINRGLRGRAISRQSWGIVSKIAAVDAVLEALPELADQVWEVHPEVTFAELAATPCGLSAGKKSADGQSRRLELLATHGLQIDPQHIRTGLKTPSVRRDDIVDAAACLLTAVRIARGQATFLPQGPPPRDGAGRRMQIAA
jgi:predicted RNase H-like nuclease